MSRERGWLTLAEAVHKITDKPARRFGIAKRGRLEKGNFADVVVFRSRNHQWPGYLREPNSGADRYLPHISNRV